MKVDVETYYVPKGKKHIWVRYYVHKAYKKARFKKAAKGIPFVCVALKGDCVEDG